MLTFMHLIQQRLIKHSVIHWKLQIQSADKKVKLYHQDVPPPRP